MQEGKAPRLGVVRCRGAHSGFDCDLQRVVRNRIGGEVTDSASGMGGVCCADRTGFGSSEGEEVFVSASNQ